MESIQRIFKVIKKELKSRNQLKAEPLKNFEENSTKISNQYKRMILYFNNKEISNNWERSRRKDHQAQKWANTTIRIFLSFQKEKSQWLEENEEPFKEEDIKNFVNKPHS